MQATIHIAGYDDFEQIALGGMAAVYKARKSSLNKTVAIKVLYPHLAGDSAFIGRFRREAEAAAQIQHENIVNVMDFGEFEGSYFIVMEYYDGATVEELIDRYGRVPPAIATAITANVGHGLEAAGAAGLVHRDIKPANIIFTNRGGVKVADFGLARSVEREKLVTRQGGVLGTPAYMSPEQTRGDHLDARSDLFSLGVVAYELLSGRRPFDGDNYAEVIGRIQSDTPVPVRGWNPFIGEELSECVGRLLEKEAGRRFDTAAIAAAAIEVAMDASGFRCDRRLLARYYEDPAVGLDRWERVERDALAHGRPGNLDEVTYFRRRLYLSPGDADAAGALEALGWVPPNQFEGQAAGERVAGDTRSDPARPRGAPWLDPDKEYKVLLEEIDLSRETPATFALKLSMRLHSPLPRIRTIVNTMPSMVATRLTAERAGKLARVIERLGGTAKTVALDSRADGENAGPGSRRPPNRAKVGAAGSNHSAGSTADAPRRPKSIDKTQVYHPLDEAVGNDGVGFAGQAETASFDDAKSADPPAGSGRRTRSKATKMCKRCGWEDEVDATFCAICLTPYGDPEPIDLRPFADPGVIDNPLADPNSPIGRRRLAWLAEAPPRVKWIAAAGLVTLLLLILFGR